MLNSLVKICLVNCWAEYLGSLPRLSDTRTTKILYVPEYLLCNDLLLNLGSPSWEPRRPLFPMMFDSSVPPLSSLDTSINVKLSGSSKSTFKCSFIMLVGIVSDVTPVMSSMSMPTSDEKKLSIFPSNIIVGPWLSSLHECWCWCVSSRESCPGFASASISWTVQVMNSSSRPLWIWEAGCYMATSRFNVMMIFHQASSTRGVENYGQICEFPNKIILFLMSYLKIIWWFGGCCFSKGVKDKEFLHADHCFPMCYFKALINWCQYFWYFCKLWAFDLILFLPYIKNQRIVLLCESRRITLIRS